jgi:hypothetical protein
MREAELPPAQWVDGYLEGLFTDAAPAGVVEEALAMMQEVRAAGMRPIENVNEKWPHRARQKWPHLPAVWGKSRVGATT